MAYADGVGEGPAENLDEVKEDPDMDLEREALICTENIGDVVEKQEDLAANQAEQELEQPMLEELSLQNQETPFTFGIKNQI